MSKTNSIDEYPTYAPNFINQVNTFYAYLPYNAENLPSLVGNTSADTTMSNSWTRKYTGAMLCLVYGNSWISRLVLFKNPTGDIQGRDPSINVATGLPCSTINHSSCRLLNRTMFQGYNSCHPPKWSVLETRIYGGVCWWYNVFWRGIYHRYNDVYLVRYQVIVSNRWELTAQCILGLVISYFGSKSTKFKLNETNYEPNYFGWYFGGIRWQVQNMKFKRNYS